jgi:O-antigen/teichoic acid export membrane protein
MTARTGAGLRGQAAQSAAAAIGSTALSAVASVIIARKLGVVARGQFAVISSLAVLLGTFSMLGLPTAASFAAARLAGDERTRVVQAALWAAAALALLAGLAYALGSWFLLSSSAGRAVVLSGAGVASVIVLSQVSRQVALTTVPVGWFASSQVASAILMLIGVALLADRLTIGVVVALSILASASGVLLALVGLVRHRVLGRRVVVRGLRQASAILRPYIGYAMMTFGTISLAHLTQRADVLLIQAYRGSRDAGLYAVAVQVSDLMLVVPGALGYVVFRAGARSDYGHWGGTLRTLRWTVGLSTVVAAGLGVLASPLMDGVFGSGYASAAEPLRWLLPGAVLLALQSVMSSYIAARGRPRRVLLAWLTGATVGLGLDLVAIPAYGIRGAAAVSSFSYLVVLLLHLEALRAVRSRDVEHSPG